MMDMGTVEIYLVSNVPGDSKFEMHAYVVLLSRVK